MAGLWGFYSLVGRHKGCSKGNGAHHRQGWEVCLGIKRKKGPWGLEKSRGPHGGGRRCLGFRDGRNGWVGRREGEMSMTGKDEEQGHAVVQSRIRYWLRQAVPACTGNCSIHIYCLPFKMWWWEKSKVFSQSKDWICMLAFWWKVILSMQGCYEKMGGWCP